MAERRVVEVASAPKHYNPIPTCVTLGNLILPSVVGAYDPKLAPEQQGPEVQIEKSFSNMKNIVEAAGGTLKNIGKVTVYITNFEHRELVNKAWLKMFPDENRPARHIVKTEMPPHIWVQIDVIAAL
jgi:2-iminobutanoate/2-iminopropanoate deaminase